jgi:transcriptional regulator with XRE-family HTH domain
MTWKNRLVRLSRALTDASQRDFAAQAEVDRALLADYELGRCEPGPEHLKNLAQAAGLTIPAGQQILAYADALRRPRQRAGEGIETLNADLSSLVSRVYQRLLRLPPSGDASGVASPEDVEEQWSVLKKLSEEQRLTVVRVARGFQSPALAERVRAEAEAAEVSDPERAASLARLAGEIEGRGQKT